MEFKLACSIVIPTYKHWELCHSLLYDIYNKFPNSTEVIVVDDYSQDAETSGGLSWWKENALKDRLQVFTNTTNLGFLKSSNLGVSKASGDVVILISTDVTIIDYKVIEKVYARLEDTPTLVGVRLLDYDTGWNKIGDKIYPYLEGWFLAFRKKDWDKFGGFDETFAPNDFEDVDLATTYLANGGKLAIIDTHITHLGGQSIGFTDARMMLTETNKLKFKNKWTEEKI